MCLRIYSALAFASLIAACAPTSGEPDGQLIDCAIGPGADFLNACTLEIVAGSSEFLIHSPDGSFRRFQFEESTGEISVSDGAESLSSFRDEGDIVELEVAGDRFRVPLGEVAGRSE